jgi:hypothetical protein
LSLSIISHERTGQPCAFDVVQSENFIRVTGRGFWSVKQIDDHFARLERTLDESRLAQDSALVLVDLRDATVQAAAVADRLGWWTERLYSAQDRVAIVLASSLLKAQMRRVPMAATRELFLSPMAALTWLTAGLRGPAVAHAA